MKRRRTESDEAGAGRRGWGDGGAVRKRKVDELDLEVLELSRKQRLSMLLLTAVALFLGIAIFWFLVQYFQTTYGAWLLLAFLAPMSVFYTKVWTILSTHYEEWQFIRVEVDSMRAPLLFTAVAHKIEQVAEARPITCSSDMDGCCEYDKSTGRTQVHVRFWGSRPRSIRMRLHVIEGDHREIMVQFSRGADVVCGREQAVQNREQFILWMRASGDRLADKGLLKQWLDACLDAHSLHALR